VDLNISAWTHPWGARSAGPRGMGDSMRVVADRWRDPPATARPNPSATGAQGDTGPQDNDMAAVAARWADSTPPPPRGPAAGAAAAPAAATPLMSTWDMMEHVWDRHKRPDHLLIPDVVNSYTIDQMLVYKSHYQQQEKQEGKGDSVFTRDAKLPTKSYPAGDDNCAEQLHPARFERLPVVPLARFWDAVPTRRPVFRHLQLAHIGCNGMVNEAVIGRMHDRSIPLRLAMFSKKHFGKKYASTDELTDGGDMLSEMAPVREALLNFAGVYQMLWPMDMTPYIIQRVLEYFR